MVSNTYTYNETHFESLPDGGVRIQWNNASVDIPAAEWAVLVAVMADKPKPPRKRAKDAKSRR